MVVAQTSPKCGTSLHEIGLNKAVCSMLRKFANMCIVLSLTAQAAVLGMYSPPPIPVQGRLPRTTEAAEKNNIEDKCGKYPKIARKCLVGPPVENPHRLATQRHVNKELPLPLVMIQRTHGCKRRPGNPPIGSQKPVGLHVMRWLPAVEIESRPSGDQLASEGSRHESLPSKRFHPKAPGEPRLKPPSATLLQ